MSKPVSQASQTVSTAAADPDPGVRQVSFQQLGLGDEVELSGLSASRTLFVPVPDGVTPTALDARVELVGVATEGRLEVRAGDRTVGVVAVHGSAESGPAAVRLDLGGVVVRDGGVNLELRSFVDVPPVFCAAETVPVVRVSDGAVTFSGPGLPPRLVSDYLPPLLNRLDLYVADPPTPAEIEGVARLTARVVSRYASIPVEVHLAPLDRDAAPPPAEFDPFARAIVVREQPQTRTELVTGSAGPTLVITGRGDQLRQQIDTFTDRLGALQLATSSTTLRLTPKAELATDRQSFADVGVRSLSVSGVGTLDLPLPFSQADLGGLVDNLTVRLQGVASPLADGAQASLSVLLNDHIVRTEATVGPSFDLSVPLPAPLIRRNNDLRLRVQYTPVGGRCERGAHPFDLQLSPQSGFEVSFGVPQGVGFSRFPQALLPTFSLAVDSPSFTRADQVVRLTGLLQRASSRALQPVVVALSEVQQTKGPIVVVSETNDLVRALGPAVDLRNGEGLDADGQRSLSLHLDGNVATLQAFSHEDQQVLLLTYRGDETLATDLLTQLALRKGGWLDLSGDVLAEGVPATPVNLQVRAPAEQDVVDGTAPVEDDGPWWAIGWVVLGIVVLIVGGLALRRIRRGRRS